MVIAGEGVKPYVTLLLMLETRYIAFPFTPTASPQHKWVSLSLFLFKPQLRLARWFSESAPGFGSMIYVRGLKETHKTDDRIQLCKPAFPLHNVSDRYATLTAMGFGFMGIK